MRITRRAIGATALRIGISAVLIGAVFVAIRQENVVLRDLWPGAGFAVAAALLWSAGVATLAVRFRMLAGAEGMHLTAAEALRLTLEGHALGQVSPGLVGGDIWRSLRLTRAGLPAASAIRVVVLDRVIGLAGLALLAWAAWTAAFAVRGQALLVALPVLAAIIAAGAFVARARIARFLHGRLKLLDTMSAHLGDPAHRRRAPAMLALSIAGHLLNVAAFLAIGRGLGLQVPAVTGLAILAIAFFLAALPVAFGGWGAREAAVAAGFASFGVDPALPVATSVAYGLMILAAALPALAMVVAPWRRRIAPA